MSGFTPKQLRALRRKLDRRHVHQREFESRSVDYIEGWFAISEANAIFGFDGWDREMTHFERLYERNRNDRTSCAYVARVRLRVRAGDRHVIREGTGWGTATAAALGDAHERALKAAETDATKRALATFGNRFGLSLYDKEQSGVTPKRSEPSGFCLHAPDGVALAENLSPEGFCGGLRQLIEKLDTLSELESLYRLNAKSLDRLRKESSALKTNKGIHYADVLERLVFDRSNELAKRGAPEPLGVAGPLKASKIAPGPRIDKSVLTIGTERRRRDKAHLQLVASHPCLVCARQPCHAHHLTFAQARGISLKVSDEFTVPLCAVHHDALHRSGPERTWWHEQGINPEPIATELWATSRSVTSTPNLRANGLIPAEDLRPAANGAEHPLEE